MRILDELKRRNVFQNALLYIVASWLILQVADVLFDNLGAPAWAFKLVFGLLVLFFIPVIVFTWIFEVTPEGIKREQDIRHSAEDRDRRGRKIGQLSIALLILAVVAIVADRLIPDATDPAQLKATASAVSQPIAVLPFVNFSPDPEQDYFAEGLTEELLSLLSSATDLRVIGRTSSFKFKDRDADLRDIAEQLGAGYVVEGGVRRADDSIRITARLIGADDGVHIWSETYDRELDDLFEVQASIARAVVAALELEFLGLDRSQAYDVEAYDHYLKGLYFRRVPGPANAQQALTHLQRAVELDPTLVPAWNELAQLYTRETIFWSMPPGEGIQRINEAIDRALELDPDAADAYSTLGFAKMNFELDWEAARRAFERATELDPHQLTAVRGLAALAAAQGDIDAGIRAARISQQIDPLDLSGLHNEAFFHYLNRDFEDARDDFKKTRALAGQPYGAGQGLLALALLGEERLDEALAEAEKEPIEPMRLATRSLILFKMGQKALSDELFETFVTRYGDRAAVPIAGNYAQRGNFDKAFEWLHRAYEQRDAQLLWTLVHPLHEPLSDDPRYDAFLQKIGLTPPG